MKRKPCQCENWSQYSAPSKFIRTKLITLNFLFRTKSLVKSSPRSPAGTASSRLPKSSRLSEPPRAARGLRTFSARARDHAMGLGLLENFVRGARGLEGSSSLGIRRDRKRAASGLWLLLDGPGSSRLTTHRCLRRRSRRRRSRQSNWILPYARAHMTAAFAYDFTSSSICSSMKLSRRSALAPDDAEIQADLGALIRVTWYSGNAGWRWWKMPTR